MAADIWGLLAYDWATPTLAWEYPFKAFSIGALLLNPLLPFCTLLGTNIVLIDTPL